ncbi:MAG: hypothetical protein NHB32_15795 [Fischerella sp. CENA71]|nr:hypothetical protein [Fischerella sp. CENA71]
MPAKTVVITVADREADIYQLFALARQRNSEFLIRAAQEAGSRVQGAGRRIRHGNSEFSSKGEELPPAPRSLPPASFGEVQAILSLDRSY